MIMSKIKIWHFILFIWLLVFVFRFERVIDLIKFFFEYFKLISTEFSFAINQFSLSLADHLISTFIFLSIPVILLMIVRRRKGFLNERIYFSVSVLIILLFLFLFCTVITDRHPDFYKDILVTKLLTPLSSVNEIRLKKSNQAYSDIKSEFLGMKNEVVKQPFNDLIIYCDSAKILEDRILYYQKGIEREISLNEVSNLNGKYFSNKNFMLGTDEFGRDIFTRLVYGTRLSLFIGLSAVVISFLIGMLLGFLAGYKSGWLDIILNRTSDLFLAFPVIFLIVFVIALFGNNIIAVIVVLGLSGWMSLFKLVKSEVSTIKKKDFFISSSLLGLSNLSLMKKEVLPLILAPVIINIVFQFGNVIMAESALSYLGLGLGNEYASWGSMIQSGQEYIYQSWWMIIIPGLLLVITLLTINDIGKKIKEYYNPRVKYD